MTTTGRQCTHAHERHRIGRHTIVDSPGHLAPASATSSVGPRTSSEDSARQRPNSVVCSEVRPPGLPTSVRRPNDKAPLHTRWTTSPRLPPLRPLAVVPRPKTRPDGVRPRRFHPRSGCPPAWHRTLPVGRHPHPRWSDRFLPSSTASFVRSRRLSEDSPRPRWNSTASSGSRRPSPRGCRRRPMALPVGLQVGLPCPRPRSFFQRGKSVSEDPNPPGRRPAASPHCHEPLSEDSSPLWRGPAASPLAAPRRRTNRPSDPKTGRRVVVPVRLDPWFSRIVKAQPPLPKKRWFCRRRCDRPAASPLPARRAGDPEEPPISSHPGR